MEIPRAHNALNSLGTFTNRMLYKESVYPSGVVAVPIDMWYDKPLYGKVNSNNDPVFPSEAFLKQLNSEETLFSINFVTDAFNDLKDFFQKAAQRNKINTTTSEIQTLEAKLSWNNVNNTYHKYISVLFDIFNETFMKDDREDRLKDFDSFIRIFIEYIDALTPNFPFTRTSYITSKFCSPLVSGLMIELKEEKHDDDRNKFEKFLQDPNYTFYTKAARQFGFVVDKNAPWRLIADIASPAMKKYLDQNKISLDNLFDRLYYESFLLDIDVLKVYILQFYNSFIDLNPTIQIPKITSNNSPITEIFTRKKVTMDEIDHKFDINFWIKMLAYIRAREVNITLTQHQFDHSVNIAQGTRKFVDMETALRYINRKFRGVPPSVFDFKLTDNDLKLQASESLLTTRFRDFSFF